MKFYRQSDLNSRMPYIKEELERKGIEDKERQNKIINICNEQDPSGNLAKYTLWIIKQFLNGENIKDCKKIISEYEMLVKKKKISENKRDINKLSLKSLKDIVDGSSDITNTVPKDYGRHIRKIDSDDDLTLYLIDDFETAKYLWGKNTSWCITQKGYWDEYTYDGEYPDFYCIYKNGKPYTLLHCEGKQDIEMTEDTIPTDKELLEIAPILLKNKVPYVDEYNPITLRRLGIGEIDAIQVEDYKKSFIPESDDDMEKAFQAIKEKLITKEEYKEIFEQILNEFDAEYSYNLLYERIITPNDGELFELVLKKVLESHGLSGDLLLTRTITNKDGEIFKQVVKNYIEQYSDNAYELLRDKIIKKEDGELFNKVVEKTIENPSYAFVLLSNKIITNKDGEIFKKAVEKAIEKSYRAYDLLYSKIITKEDGEIFKKLLEKALENSERAYDLLYLNKIKKSDVSPELWEKILSFAERYEPDIRQKFGSRNFRRSSNMRFYKIFSKNNFRRKAEKEENSDIRIYITNLGKYNEGELVGEWVTLPVDDNFKSVLERIGISDKPDKNGIVYEEYFITDYEAPFEIGEYDNIYELNELAEKLDDFDSLEKKVFFYCKDNGYDVDKAFEIVLDHSYSLYEASSPTDLAYEVIEEMGGIDSLAKNTLENYFDYESFGKTLTYEGFHKLDYDYYIELEE